jgi:hypothetical protein
MFAYHGSSQANAHLNPSEEAKQNVINVCCQYTVYS